MNIALRIEKWWRTYSMDCSGHMKKDIIEDGLN